MEFRDFFDMLKRRWKILLVSIVVIAALSLVFFSETKSLYSATSKVLVRTTDSTWAGYEKLPHLAEIASLEGVRNVQTQTELLKSGTVFEKTIDDLGLDASEVVTRKIEPVGDSDVIAVTIVANSRDAAVNVANRLPDVYLRLNNESLKKDAGQSRDFFEHQLETSMTKLQKAEETLRAFKEENNISDLAAESEHQVASLVAMERELVTTKTERDGTNSRIRNLESQLTSEEKEIVAFKVISENPIVKELKQKLAMLEIEQVRLTQNFSNRHPQVIETNAQIQKIQDELKDAAVDMVSSKTLQQNPMRKLLLEQLAILHADRMAIDSKIGYLASVIDVEKQKLTTLPKEEMALARLVRDRDLAQEMSSVLEEKYQDFKVTEQTKKVAGRIIEYAKDARNYTGRKKASSILLSVIISLTFGLGIVFSLEYLDEALYTAADVEKALGLQTLAQIPKDSLLNETLLHTHKKPNSPVSEAFRALRNKLRFLLAERGMNTISVTSSTVGEGKSVVSLNLAITMAQFGKRVLLIDGDLRRPKLHNYFGVKNEGLTNVVVDEDDVTRYIVETPVENLSFLPGGPLPLVEASPIIASELFESPRIASVLDMLKKLYDFIIIDTPPVLAVTDPLSVAAHCDGIIFVVSSGRTRHSHAKKAKAELDTLSTPLIGSVLNNTPPSQQLYSRYLYYYYETGAKANRK